MDQRQILSIIILSYESEKNIESITRKVIHTMKEENIPFEIIIMDDGSKDQSYRIAQNLSASNDNIKTCLLYTSDAADERSSVDLGGRRIIKKKNIIDQRERQHHKLKETNKITQN